MSEKPYSGPVETFRHGAISASVFENQSKDSDGTFFSVTLQRRYQDEAGEWQTTNSYLRDQMPIAMDLFQRAYRFVLETDEARRAAGKQSEGG